MKRSAILLFSLILILPVSAATAQDFYKYEFKANFGYTISPALNVISETIPGAVVDRISPRSSFSYGLQFDYRLSERFSVGFLFAPQLSQLVARTQLPTPAPATNITGVPGNLAFADIVTYNYHGVATYHFGSEKKRFRPFVFGGAGITRYGSSTLFLTVIGTPGFSGSRTIDGATKFSPTMGGGIKTFVSPRLGFQVMGRWTPTHISETSSGIWCGQYWGCFQLNGSQWSNQIELTGGVIIRF